MPADPFRWLEDGAHPDTARWAADHETAYAAAAAAWSIRGRFAARLRELATRSARITAPRPAGGRLFLTRHDPGADHPAVVVVEPGGEHRVLVDPAALDPTGATTLEAWQPSWEGDLLAYQLATGGTEDAGLWVLDVATGRVVDGPIDRIRNCTPAWLPGGRVFYYVRRLDPALHPGEGAYHRRVYLHTVGTDPAEDTFILGSGRPMTQHYAVRTAPDGSLLVITASAGTAPRKDVWLADLRRSMPESPELTVVQEGLDARTVVLPRPGGCHVLTDLATRRGRLARCAPADPGPDAWVDVVPEDPEAVLDDVAVLDDPGLPVPLLLVARTRHAVGELTVHDLRDGRPLHRLPLPPCSSIGPLRAAAAGAGEVWFTVATFTAPPVVYRFDGSTGIAAPWTGPWEAESSQEAGPADGLRIEARQVCYTSTDGTPVRMFVLVEAGPERARPTILTAYGGFGVSMAPAYSPEVIAWVEAGGVYAVACVRGGGEEGEDWHRAGMFERKQNTVDDVHSAAAHLVTHGWTTPAQLGIWGASNGGMVAGAALIQRPDAYGAVICVAPLLDMARYHASGLGPSWTAEYGDPTDARQLAWLLDYSPYHNVRHGRAYPAVMFMVFDGDSRVDPWHARKMCAALEDATSGTRPVLYRLERGVGHGERSMTSTLDLLTDMLAFFAHELGTPEAG